MFESNLVLRPVDSPQYPPLDKIGDDPYVRQNQRHYDVDIRPCGIVYQRIVATATYDNPEPVSPDLIVANGVVTGIPDDNPVPGVIINTAVRQIVVVGTAEEYPFVAV